MEDNGVQVKYTKALGSVLLDIGFRDLGFSVLGFSLTGHALDAAPTLRKIDKIYTILDW